jgi:3-oxoacyl-[acyl-carrier protein] reductase
MPFSLAGRRALVTGGSQGIGKATGQMLAECGADVALVFLRSADEHAASAQLAHSEIVSRGRKALLIDADVTKQDDLGRAKAEVIQHFGGLDILVNAAGGFPTRPKPLFELGDLDWDRSVELNLRSVFLCCRLFGPIMRAQNYGRIISLSSGAGAFGLAEQSHYSASKAGIVGMSKALARELGPYGVTCNVVTPGRIDTPMSRMGLEKDWWRERPAEFFPMRRIGKPEDVASAVCYFASDEAGWITGQVLQVNGGSYM